MGKLLCVTIALAIGCGGEEEPAPRTDGGAPIARAPAAADEPEPEPRPCADSLFACEIAMASHPGVECANPLATELVACKLKEGFGVEGACRVPCTMMSPEQCDLCIEARCAAAWTACQSDR